MLPVSNKYIFHYLPRIIIGNQILSLNHIETLTQSMTQTDYNNEYIMVYRGDIVFWYSVSTGPRKGL